MNKGYCMQGLDLAVECVKLICKVVAWLYKKAVQYTR